MPKATASWLIENTTLSFDQISNLLVCILEIQAIADGEVSSGMLARNQLKMNHKRGNKKSEGDKTSLLNIKESDIPLKKSKTIKIHTIVKKS